MKKNSKRKEIVINQTNNQANQVENANNPVETDKKTLSVPLHEGELKEDSLSKRESAIKIQEQNLIAEKKALTEREKELNEKQVDLLNRETQAKSGFPSLFNEQFSAFRKQLEDRESKCNSEWEAIEIKKEKLRQRETELKKAEIQKNKGFLDEKLKLENELHEMKIESLAKIEIELTEKRENLIAQLESELAETRDSITEKSKALYVKEAELEKRENQLAIESQLIQTRQDKLVDRELNIDNEVERRIEKKKQSFEKQIKELEDENHRILESVTDNKTLFSKFEHLKHELGDQHPGQVLAELKSQKESIKLLNEQLAERPIIDIEEFSSLSKDLDQCRTEIKNLTDENKRLIKNARDKDELEMEIDILTDEKKSLERQLEITKAESNRLMEDIRRLQSSYEREQDRDSRIKDIESPYIKKELIFNTNEISEIDWLNSIDKSCKDFGLKFPRRILHAFHTSLKTSEWSPITVLAGVSGTGKSELPRLYSHFGGINFLPLSVQPNWDSQEAMLGFFNSIDNKFDAQSVLQFLAQTQKKRTEENQYGLRDTINLILLDEMNLAHIELYFAEFLSKFELRRGSKGDKVPKLEVKLGAGIQPYHLPLGRNVLWAGTMNQDETTKSLSDKVLDRGIIINFPRPTKLKRRNKLIPLENLKSTNTQKAVGKVVEQRN